MVSIIRLFEAVLLPLVSLAASTPPAVLPANANFTNIASAQIYNADFTTDPSSPRLAAIPGHAPLHVFAYTKGAGPDGVIAYTITVKNQGTYIARSVALGITHPDSMILQASSPTAHTHVSFAGKTELMWFLPDLVAGAQEIVTLTFSGSEDPALGVQTSFTYQGQQRVAGTTQRVLQAVDDPVDEAAAPEAPAAKPPKQPAIICHPAEINCTQILPNLGVNFQRAVQNDSRPVVCSSLDPEGCQEKRPQLGKRFNEAVSVIEPGECRVAEDAIVSDPRYHDAFLRQTLPAAAFMRPLFNSGQDFKQLVHQAILDSIKHSIRVRRELFPIWQQAWQQHADIINQVLQGDLSGADATSRLQNLLTSLAGQIEQRQAGLEQDYRTIRDQRLDRYDPVKDKAVANTAESIQLACGALNGEDQALKAVLENLKETIYIPLLESFVIRYTESTAPQFAALALVRQLFESTLFPALAAYDNGNRALLQSYNTSTMLSLFDETFRTTYIAHADQDEAQLESFRLGQWEIALDTPKTTATQCEFQRKVVERIQDVETTSCESGSYAESLARSGQETVKGQAGALQPPQDLSGQGSSTAINPALVQGVACGLRPGDPYWAPGCECKCGDDIETTDPGTGEVTVQKCEAVYAITRHDIYVTTQSECNQDGIKHADPFF